MSPYGLLGYEYYRKMQKERDRRRREEVRKFLDSCESASENSTPLSELKSEAVCVESDVSQSIDTGGDDDDGSGGDDDDPEPPMPPQSVTGDGDYLYQLVFLFLSALAILVTLSCLRDLTTATVLYLPRLSSGQITAVCSIFGAVLAALWKLLRLVRPKGNRKKGGKKAK